MDITGANRTNATIAASLPATAVAASAVAGNDKNGDPLVARAAGEPEPGAKAGNGDSGELRAAKTGPGNEYTAEERAELQELRARDREVRAHELAHLAAAGPHSRGGASFSYESGPDGRRYAIAGEVSIDTSEVAGDPAATLAKARQVQRAALAPAQPSSQDRRIAAQAAAMAAEASAEIAQERVQLADRDEATGASSIINRTYGAANDATTSLIELVA